jgi:hypothetical protein
MAPENNKSMKRLLVFSLMWLGLTTVHASDWPQWPRRRPVC